MLRMKHEKHGFCHAYDANEEKRLRGFGWIGEDEDSPAEEKAPVITVQEPAPRRPGRPRKGQ